MKNLKEKIADKLIEQLKTRTLDKITISTITNDLGVSRQAFYYHFFDIYEVIEWIYKEAATKILNEHGSLENWQVAFLAIMNWCKENKSFVTNSFKSINREYIDTFMTNILSPYIKKAVEVEAANYDVKESQKDFISQFLIFAFNSLIINWIKHDMSEEPESLVQNVETLMEGDVQKSIMNFSKRNKEEEK